MVHRRFSRVLAQCKRQDTFQLRFSCFQAEFELNPSCIQAASELHIIAAILCQRAQAVLSGVECEVGPDWSASAPRARLPAAARPDARAARAAALAPARRAFEADREARYA